MRVTFDNKTPSGIHLYTLRLTADEQADLLKAGLANGGLTPAAFLEASIEIGLEGALQDEEE